ncbi:PREDICTED: putative leucine-rich repeat receptor-like serine/threonine-protein kinase At2g14440 [Nelumbo nucifera]|uniref:Malectin-like domain-containing protein n=2 Tax=Nelumbo nucifera TaxID=4432 RepID=A0A822YZ35_NELNU|nr:PREDICTED: putative leucine-rich repeat receptor-like serine/threonine-protein kinase At2g14440 [Nelumbo nucifera]DAD37503.1 TPA_asm: hypothetical protein HUJ06_008144 [Nelumbo nucifera]
MSLSIFLLWLVSIPLAVDAVRSPPRGFRINSGGSKEIVVGSLDWIADDGFITVGNKTTLDDPNLMPLLSTLRFFPDKSARKYCYEIPVSKGGKYMIRTIYYYGGFDGGKVPPVFDQIIEGTKWSVVNTTDDFANGLSSYYEIIVVTRVKMMSVCLARNEHTVSSPFINALELDILESSMYNSTNFSKHALITVARNSFGYDGDMISFPDDAFNRYWQPFKDSNPIVASQSNVSSEDFWNFPPSKVFLSAITTSPGKALHIQWPTVPLPRSNYYIALYFQDNRSPSPYSWRVFNVTVDGMNFYNDLNATDKGVSVYATSWPLSGTIEIILTPGEEVPVGPIINAGEILQIFPLGGRTLTRDVMAMEDIAEKLNNPPPDWHGDPCLPHENSWTGVSCSQGHLARVTTLNLTNLGLSGTLSPSVANLTALAHLWAGGNKLTGTIPNLLQLNELVTLHLENNQFEGPFPQSLGKLAKLREIFLQNNNLQGTVPDILKKKPGLNIQVSPGNHLTESV